MQMFSPQTHKQAFSLSLPHLQEIKPAAFDRSQRADHCFSLEHANSNEIHFTQHFRLDFISWLNIKRTYNQDTDTFEEKEIVSVNEQDE